MHAAKLTEEQRQQVLNKLVPTTQYLDRLSKRMQKLGWHPDDPAYVEVWRAREHLVSLCMAFHYAGTTQAWHPPAEPPERPLGEGKKGLRNTYRNRAR